MARLSLRAFRLRRYSKAVAKDAVDYLVQSLESGRSEVLNEYLSTMARFHTYSFGNVMLIARQKPDATNVAGIHAWNSLGRFVKRSEKGILILAPMVGHRRSRQNQIATDIDTDNTADERKHEPQLIGFRAVYVFDVSQTEGKELPTLTEAAGRREGIPRTAVRVRAVARSGIDLLRAPATHVRHFDEGEWRGHQDDPGTAAPFDTTK